MVWVVKGDNEAGLSYFLVPLTEQNPTPSRSQIALILAKEVEEDDGLS